MNIAFRVEGGKGIGLGHIMRCITLAGEFRSLGHSVVFFSSLDDGVNRIKQEGYTIEKTNRIADLIASLKHGQIDLLIIDSYDVNIQLFLDIKPYVKKICYIDDINKFTHPVDILLNGNINAQDLDYQKHNSNQLMLIGTEFTLLRNEFKDIPERKINKEVKSIMITSGATNPDNVVEKIIKILLDDENLRNLKINVIVGSSFENVQELRKVSGENPNIILHEKVKEISKVMLESDVAISTAGSTLYELCSCGTPTISFVIAENQQELANRMDKLGYIKCLGWYNEFKSGELTSQLKQLIKDIRKREIISKRMQNLIDGQGANRAAKLIIRHTEE